MKKNNVLCFGSFSFFALVLSFYASNLYAQANIPAGCSTPGDCAELTPTFTSPVIRGDNSNSVTLQAPTSGGHNTFTLPDSVGDADQTIVSDGAGVLSFGPVVGPVGSIIMWPLNACPAGYLELDGSTQLDATYPDLAAVLGTTYGGSAGTNFVLPDLRGRFVRGRDNGAGNDPDAGSRTAVGSGPSGDNAGSVQANATAVNGLSTAAAGAFTPSGTITSGSGHTHNVPVTQTGVLAFEGGALDFQIMKPGGSTATDSNSGGGTFTGNPVAAHTHTINSSDNETRPANISLTYCIKAN